MNPQRLLEIAMIAWIIAMMASLILIAYDYRCTKRERPVDKPREMSSGIVILHSNYLYDWEREGWQ